MLSSAEKKREKGNLKICVVVFTWKKLHVVGFACKIEEFSNGVRKDEQAKLKAIGSTCRKLPYLPALSIKRAAQI